MDNLLPLFHNPAAGTHAIASAYVAGGFSVFPLRLDGSKKVREGFPTWKPWQSRHATDAELTQWFGKGRRAGIAIVHGAISGNSEVLDFDVLTAFDEFVAIADDHGMGDVVRRCVHVRTPTGGHHLYYRCAVPVEGNKKLAMVAVPVATEGRADADMKAAGYRPYAESPTGWAKIETKIETRGEGGYTVAVGSPNEVHDEKRPYTLMPGPNFSQTPTLTADERNGLLAMARACNVFVEPDRQFVAPKTEARPHLDGLRPGDDYNNRASTADIVALLQNHGWTVTGQRGDIVDFARPGKTKGVSATLNAVSPGWFYVFSSSVSDFEMLKGYTAYQVFAILECGGNFSEAARRLGADGYGAHSRSVPPGNSNKGPSPVMSSDEPPLTTAYKLTDLGNAERFVDAYADTFQYDHDMKAWHRYDGRRWVLDATSQVQERAKATVRGMYEEGAREPDDDRRAAVIKHAMASEKASRVAAIAILAQTDPQVAVRQSTWDADPWLFNCENGTINLRTGELRPHSATDRITRLAPVVYDPDAEAPTWGRCLERWQPDADVRRFLARAAGYSLTGSVGEETAFFTFGMGRNGKSKFTGALASIMGDYAARVSIEALMDTRRAGQATPDLVPLVGARLVVASEVYKGRRLNESFVKDLTGGDPVTARANYGATFTFKPSFKLWLYGNHKPLIQGTDDGIWARLPLIPFTVTIPAEERDPDLSAKLEAEASGILAWAVRGCLEWQRMRLVPPEAVVRATNEYRAEQDSLGRFFSDVCVVDPGSAMFTTAAALRTAYAAWTDGEGDRRPVPYTELTARLIQMGLEDSKSKRVDGKTMRVWWGLGLLSERDSGGFVTDVTDVTANYEVSDVHAPREESPVELLQPLHLLQPSLCSIEEEEEREEIESSAFCPPNGPEDENDDDEVRI